MVIGIDIDNVCVNTTSCILEQHYADTGERLTLDDIKTYYIENYVSKEYRDDFHLIFLKKEMWKRVKVLPHCVEVIKRLHDMGEEIYFVTATEPQNVAKKARFLQRTFPFLDIRKRLITTHCKQMIKCDVLIDDYEENLKNGSYFGILMNYPWNRNFDDASDDKIYRVFDWTQVEPMLEVITKIMTESKNKKRG